MVKHLTPEEIDKIDKRRERCGCGLMLAGIMLVLMFVFLAVSGKL